MTAPDRRGVVVIARRVGRLANRLLLFAHFVGAAVEHGFTVFDPAFFAQARYFPTTARTLFCRYPADRRILPPFPGGREALLTLAESSADLLHRFQGRGHDVGLIRLRRDQHLDLNSPAFLDLVATHRVVFVQDWFFRNADNCARHRDLICSFFTPWEKHLDAARAVVEPVRRRDRLLVGVHVRRSDYERFKGGRFFYSHDQYARLMRGVQRAFPDRDPTFLVCSDEPVPEGAFAGLDVVRGPGPEVEDLYALASCDLLLGPPSTYTTWASYYGQVPRYAVSDLAEQISPALFTIERGLGSPPPDTVAWDGFPQGASGAISTSSAENCLR
jgi:hypothetical protein